MLHSKPTPTLPRVWRVVGESTSLLARAALVALLCGSAAAEPVTASFTDSQGRTLLYRYTLEDLPDSIEPPGLLLHFHGNSSGTQESVVSSSFGRARAVAREHGLVPVGLASPRLQDGGTGDGVRHWHDEDIPVIHEFLQVGLPSRFSFDSNRIVFWGASNGSIFLNDFVLAHGTSYGGGLYSQCGGGVHSDTWEVPSGFKNRFSVFVQSTTGDGGLYRSAVQAYVFFKYRAGVPTFGDLSGPGGHCAGGEVSSADAVGWILGTRRLATDGANDEERLQRLLPPPPVTEALFSACNVGVTIEPRRGNGDPLWLGIDEEGRPEIPVGNRAYEEFEGTLGTAPLEWSIRFVASIAVDSSGNVYVLDLHRVWRIDAAGVVTAIAGTGEAGYSGDGGPAVAARMDGPSALAVDAAGNVYVADSGNHRVRRIDAAGVITTIAGTGDAFTSGDGGPAAAAGLVWPQSVAVDGAGNLYVATGNWVRRIDSQGTITAFAGTGESGYSGDGGPATSANFRGITDIAVDSSGNVYVADQGNHRVRRIDGAGVITTIAGTGEAGYSGDGGPASASRLDAPRGLAVDMAGNVYVADQGNHRVRRIDAAGVITTIAGTGEATTSGFGGPATEGAIRPRDLAVGPRGDIYVADAYGKLRVLARGIGDVFVAREGIRATRRVLLKENEEKIGVELGQSGEVLLLRWTEDGWFAELEHPVVDGPGDFESGVGDRRLSKAAARLVALRDQPLFEGAQVTGRNGDRYSLSQRPDGTVVASRVPPGEVAPLVVSPAAAEPGERVVDTLPGFGRLLDIAVDTAGNVYVWEQAPGTSAFVGYQRLRLRRMDPAGVITTIASSYQRRCEFQESGGTESCLAHPWGLAVDAAGNVYVGDWGAERVSRIDPAGVITTVAGVGWLSEEGSLDDGVAAIQARLEPAGLAQDAAGNLYVGDLSSHRVRRIDPAGVITTVAGTGTAGYSGDGGPAIEARLHFPDVLALDAAGNLYVMDRGNHRLRRIDPAGVITTVAGTGSRRLDFADGVPATEVDIIYVRGLAVDATGSVYFGAGRDGRVRRIDPAGIVSTFGGDWRKQTSGDGRPVTKASFDYPQGLAFDAAGNLLVATLDGLRIVSGAQRQVRVPLGSSGDTLLLPVAPGGSVTKAGRPVLDGTQVAACNDDVYTLQRTSNGSVRAVYVSERQAVGLGEGEPATLVRDEQGTWRIGGEIVRSGSRYYQDGREYALDRLDGRWRLASHALRTVAGNSGVEDGIPATVARLYSPSAVAADSSGNLYVADRDNNRIRRVDTSGTISTLAGTGVRGFGGDGGPASGAQLNRPSGVAVGPGGNVYIADTGNQRVRRIDVSGTIHTFSGTGLQAFQGDGGPADAAALNNPIGVATDKVGNVYVADSGNNRIRRIGLSGMIDTIAGIGTPCFGGENRPADEAELHSPTGVAVDAEGNVYIADSLNRMVRRIDTAGVISTLAASGEALGCGLSSYYTRSPDLAGEVNGPVGVAVDGVGNVYVADYLARKVTRIAPEGGITAVAGTGESGYSGDGGPATEAQLESPVGVAVDGEGNVYVADSTRHRVRRIDTAGGVATIAGTGEPFHRGDGGLASQGRLSSRLGGVAVDDGGNVYVADPVDHTVRRIDASETISTFAGTGVDGYGGDGGPAADALLNGPSGVAADAAGNVYVADTGNHRIRRIDAEGTVSTFAGTGESGYNGSFLLAASSKLSHPARVAVDADGNVYVLEAVNPRVRVVGSSGRIRTVAGNGQADSPEAMIDLLLNYHAFGLRADQIPLSGAKDLALGSEETGEANLYLGGGLPRGTNFPERLVKDTDAYWRRDGVSLLWSVPLRSGTINEVTLDREGGVLTGLALDRDGNLYFADRTGIRARSRDGSISVIADAEEYGISVGGMAVDEFGRIWFSDPDHRRVRVLEPVMRR